MDHRQPDPRFCSGGCGTVRIPPVPGVERVCCMYNVLYVDDDPHLLEIARYFIEDQGDFTVATALLATDALSLPGFASFDAIIADYEMPGMNGIAFLKKVRETWGDVPFIIFTGKGREEVVIEAINNGADFYIQKGGQPEAQFAELVHAIKKAVERRRAAAALLESERTLRINEKRLAMAQVIGHTGSWEYDLRTEKIWGSAEGLHIFGYPAVAGDFPIADIESCIPERERIHRALVDLIREGKVYDLEYAVNPADGSTPRVIHSSARLEKDMTGCPLRVIGVVQDITERKRAEDKLRESEEKYRLLTENATDIIYSIDLLGRITHIGPQVARYGYSRDDLLFRQIFEMIAEEDRGKVLQEIQAIISSGRSTRTTFRLKDSAGNRVWCEANSTVTRDKSGAATGITGVLRDITDRRQAEDALKESEEMFRSLVQESTEGIMLISEVGRVIEWNTALETILGISRDEALGMSYPELMARLIPGQKNPELVAAIEKEIGIALRTGISPFFSRKMDAEICRPDGCCRRVQHNVFPIKTAKGYRIGTILRDVTDQRTVAPHQKHPEG